MITSTRLSAAALALLSLGIIGCSSNEPTDMMEDSDSSVMDAMDNGGMQDGPIVIDRSNRDSVAAGVLEAFARGEWNVVASVTSGMGVRFTPYTNVDVEQNQTLTTEELASFDSDQTVKVWGAEDGTGLPLAMTNMQYFDRYVWDHDYRNADNVAWNETQDRGNIVDNVQQVYPGASVVEYHFDGFDPQYEGMDWRSLRLVLAQNDDGEWTLYGVIHDEWTI